MRLHQQNDTTHPITFLLVSSSDHITPVTGASPTVTISQNGGAFAAPTGTVAEVGNGWYKLTPSAADVGTLGPLLVHATATGADPVDLEYQVVAFDPYSAASLGLTNLDAAVSSRSSHAPIDVRTEMDANSTKLANLDATITSRQPAGAVDLNADQSAVTIGTVNALGAQAKADVNAEVDAALDTAIPATPTADSINERLKTLDDNYTSARAANLDNADVATSTRSSHSAADVRTEIDTNSTKLDVAVSTRQPSGAVDVGSINGDANAAARLALSAANMIPGTVQSGATTTSIPTDLVETTDDHYSGRIVLFTSGALTGQVTDVTAYDGTTKTLTVTALTEAPLASDAFLLV